MVQLHVSTEEGLVCRDVFRRPLAVGSHSNGCKPAKTAAAFSDDLQRFVIRYKTFLFLGTRSSENGGEGYAAAKVLAAGISDLRYTFPRLCTLLMRKAAKL
jgi:hypothetical protein